MTSVDGVEKPRCHVVGKLYVDKEYGEMQNSGENLDCQLPMFFVHCLSRLEQFLHNSGPV